MKLQILSVFLIVFVAQTQVTEGAGINLLGGVTNIAGAVTNAGNTLIGGIVNKTDTLVAKLNTRGEIFDTWSNMTRNLIYDTESILTDTVTNVVKIIQNALNGTTELLTDIANELNNTIPSAINEEIIDDIKSAIKSAVGVLDNIISPLGQSTSDILNTIEYALQNIITKLFDSLSGCVSDFVDTVRNATSNIPRQAWSCITNEQATVENYKAQFTNVTQQLNAQNGVVSNNTLQTIVGLTGNFTNSILAITTRLVICQIPQAISSVSEVIPGISSILECVV